MAVRTPDRPDPARPDVASGNRVERYLVEMAPLLRRVVAKVCPSSLGIDVGEVEQEVRIRLWRILSDERNITPGASYLYRTAATAVIDAVRRVRARREESLDTQGLGADTPDASIAFGSRDGVARRTELKQVLQRAFERLASDRRRAVRLHLQGLTTEEIARALDWTEPKARNIVYRGLADLRHALKALGVESAAD